VVAYTPGEWVAGFGRDFDNESKDGHWGVVALDEYGDVDWYLARVWNDVRTLEHARERDGAPSDAEANACLMAAARDLLAFAEAHKAWEAKVAMCDEVWDTADGLPHLTQELQDEWTQLQTMRNAAVAKAKGNAQRREMNDA
jgi:hypothetical protein